MRIINIYNIILDSLRFIREDEYFFNPVFNPDCDVECFNWH